MENLEEYVQDANVSIEVLPEEITEVVYLSSPDHKQDIVKCEIKVEEDATSETEQVIIPNDTDSYVVLASENAGCENFYLKEEDFQHSYHFLDNSLKTEDVSLKSIMYLCEACKAEFEDYNDLLHHFSLKHPLYVCIKCGCTCSSELSLSEHYKTHEPKQSSCDICGVVYPTAIDAANHQKTHNTKLLYACNICDAPFGSISNVSTHIRQEHAKKRKTTCS